MEAQHLESVQRLGDSGTEKCSNSGGDWHARWWVDAGYISSVQNPSTPSMGV